jgi:hypothetical protein
LTSDNKEHRPWSRQHLVLNYYQHNFIASQPV